MALTCKNCGGNIVLDTDMIICESCGARQTLNSVLSDATDSFIYNQNDVSFSELRTYKSAVSIMSTAKTENSLINSAQIFEEIPGILNADELARECREKAELLKIERLYTGALMDMKSDEPMRIENAIEIFKSLGSYKDSSAKVGECFPLLTTAKVNYEAKLKVAEEQKLREEKQKQKQMKKHKRARKRFWVLAALTVVAILLGQFFIYSPSNIDISFSPSTDNFLVEKTNSYLFTFDAKIKNKGILDVSAITATVIIEKDDEILVDTQVSFNNYSGAVVRAGKTSKYTWELTVYSYDSALILYETDIDDLDLIIDITTISYTNGKTKNF